MNTEQLKTAEDIAKKYTGEFPDVEGRKISKTWAELRSMMENDILDFASQESKRAVEKDRESRWISVKDRLPDEDVNVLCYSHTDYIEGYWSPLTKRFHPEIEDAGYMENDMMVIDVTHWQPLPEPPKTVTP